MKGELVRTTTTDKLVLNGFYCEGDKAKPLILHIHGYAGNFYVNSFTHAIADELAKNNVGFLSIETRGSYERHSVPVYGKGEQSTGAWIEHLEDAWKDIDAWVRFAVKQGYSKVILEGHSLATYKIVRYLSEGKYAAAIQGLVLLCPFDKEGFIDVESKGKWREYLLEARKKVAAGEGMEMVPSSWGGVPSSYQTFVSWYDQNEFNSIFNFYVPNHRSSVLAAIQIPVHIILGEKDEYFAQDKSHYPEILEQLRINFPNATTLLVPKARHSFRGYEEIVATSVSQFVQY